MEQARIIVVPEVRFRCDQRGIPLRLQTRVPADCATSLASIPRARQARHHSGCRLVQKAFIEIGDRQARGFGGAGQRVVVRGEAENSAEIEDATADEQAPFQG